MFLKRIEIYGFKSFAGRSVLDFEYKNNGNITAVVGPNGSGKSNVADAIRWVTGEQSSKNLRSKKGEDVIFCGSVAKARSSYAEVSITLADEKPFTFELNNKEHSLTEIEVSRKLYRSGDSDYLINHKKVRLTDIQQLLASLGFGQSSYTVIGQGMVDRLLFFTASERKVLFDEAAGVKQYEIKREQAIKKLESTDSNLIRLKDILSELEPRVVNLRRLVKRAEGRKEYEVELANAQQKYFGSLLLEYKDNIRESELKKAELNEKTVQIERKIQELQDKALEKSENLHTAERITLEAKITACTNERNKLMQEVAYLNGQIESLGRNKSLISGKKADLESEKDSLDIKIKFLTSKITNEQEALKAAISTKSEAEKPVQELLIQVDSIEKELRKPADNRSSSVDDLRNKIDHLTAQKMVAENATVRLSELKIIEKNLISDVSTTKLEQNKIQKDADKLQRRLNILEGELKKLSSLVNPNTLASIEGDIVELEKMKVTATGFTDKLDKIFVQFREISKAINNEEREKLENAVSSLSHDTKEITNTLVSLRVKLGSEEFQLKQVQSEIEVNQTKLSKINVGNNDIEELQKELARCEGSISERQNALLRQKDTLQGKLAVAKDIFYRAELEYNRLHSLLTNQEAELASAERRMASLNTELERLESQNTGEDDPKLSSDLTVLQKELNRKEEDLAKYRGGLTQVIASEREQEQSVMANEREKRILQEEVSVINSHLSRIEVEMARTQVRLEDLNEEMLLGRITVDTTIKYQYLDQMEKDVLKLKMENMRRKLETTLGVDPETEAEYIELETRSTEMSTQVADLSKAKADLEKVITELDSRIRTQFAGVFEKISTEFSRYFSMLFGGGSANLKLGEDEEGSFGIEISANPPGKRVQSLNALSGGERTLTSLALLFAILSVNPSPFCVLDEVDAALDESNTLRFVKILADLAHKTQFIIISHNRDTMKIANSLYGVTMNDEHISKLLSVKLTDALVAVK